MTDHPTAQALLATILTEPENDAARLVYADWLDEYGETSRAEYIRLAVAWGDRLCDADCDECHRMLELLEANVAWAESMARIFKPGRIVSHTDYGYGGMSGVTWQWSRGFIGSVRLPVRLWTGGECQRCGGTGEDETGPCCSCGGSYKPVRPGTGRTSGHGPAIVAAHPVTAVDFTHVAILGNLQKFLTKGWTSGHWRPVVSANAIAWAKGQRS